MGRVSGEWRKQVPLEAGRSCERVSEWVCEPAGHGAERSSRDLSATNISLTVFMLAFNEHCELMDKFDQRQTCIIFT